MNNKQQYCEIIVFFMVFIFLWSVAAIYGSLITPDFIKASAWKIKQAYSGSGNVDLDLTVQGALDYEGFAVKCEDMVSRMQKQMQNRRELFNQQAYVRDCVSKMTMEQKISQLMILTNRNDITQELLKEYQPGGVIFFGDDFTGKTKEEVKERIECLQSYMKYPLLVGVDEEGGTVSRVSGLLGKGIPVFESARTLGEGQETKLKEDTQRKIDFLKSLGINLNFEPVADVVTDETAYMYERSAGNDGKTVATYVSQIVQMMKAGNTISCVKHFPGYGNNGNTHTEYIKDERTIEEYQQCDFLPFQVAMISGVDMVMVSHLVMSAVDEEHPASLSKKVHEMLRKDFKYEGLILSDDLNMQAVLSKMTLEQASGEALIAGNDMFFSADFQASLKGVKQALDSGKLTEEQINQSVSRVLQMKIRHKLMKENTGF